MVYTARFWYSKEPLTTDINSLNKFQCGEEVLRDITENEIICKAEYIAINRKIDDQKTAIQIARVIESKHVLYPIGARICGTFGWRTHTIVTDFKAVTLCPVSSSIPQSYGLSSCGEYGLTALFGLTEICQISHGKTIVISEADSVIGAIAVQIANSHGLKEIIATANGAERCEWIKENLPVSAVIDVTDENIDIGNELQVKTPNGIDYYLDNSGGLISYYVIKQMNPNGRIGICDTIFVNEIDKLPKVPQVTDFHRRFLRMEGFNVSRWRQTTKWNDGISDLHELIADGKLRTFETVVESFEKLPQAHRDVVDKRNFGVTLIKL